jgi:hypothetical protein
MIISPNFGFMGAPQLGHFSAVAPEGARIGPVEAVACFGCGAARLAPHFMQKLASSGSWAPHLGQYRVIPPRWNNLPIIFQQFSHLVKYVDVFPTRSLHKYLLDLRYRKPLDGQVLSERAKDKSTFRLELVKHGISP